MFLGVVFLLELDVGGHFIKEEVEQWHFVSDLEEQPKRFFPAHHHTHRFSDKSSAVFMVIYFKHAFPSDTFGSWLDNWLICSPLWNKNGWPFFLLDSHNGLNQYPLSWPNAMGKAGSKDSLKPDTCICGLEGGELWKLLGVIVCMLNFEEAFLSPTFLPNLCPCLHIPMSPAVNRWLWPRLVPRNSFKSLCYPGQFPKEIHHPVAEILPHASH